MVFKSRAYSVVVALALFSAALCRDCRAETPAAAVQKTQIADGIYLFTSPDIDGIEVDGNSIAIVGADDVLVFDTNVLPSSAQRVLAEIRKITNKPVRYVVNSHWHPDHWDGNEVYAREFPGVEIIATTDTRRLMERTMNVYGKTIEKLVGDGAKQMQDALQTGKNQDGSPLSDADRKEMVDDLRIQKEFMTEYNAMKPVLPTVTFDDRITLRGASREIQIIHLPGNTTGDAVLYLPKEKILLSGDLLTSPVPFGADSHPAQWIESLKTLDRMDVKVIIPGHGEAQYDKAYLELMLQALQSAEDQVHAALAQGMTLEDTRKFVKFEELRAKFTHGDANLNAEFDGNFTQPIILAVYDEATEGLQLYQ
jgi:cyclase